MRPDEATAHDIDSATRAASAYPANLFAPGRIEFDSDDGDYRRLAVDNALVLPGEPFMLEVILSGGTTPSLCGHYLRFIGRHRKASFVARRLASEFACARLLLATEFGEAALVGDDDRTLLRMERRGANFYATHLSIASETNAWTHDRFVREARDDFKPASARSLRADPATKRLLAAIAATGAKSLAPSGAGGVLRRSGVAKVSRDGSADAGRR